MSDGLSAGFANPVGDAQRCFRSLLDAMARPGGVHRVPGSDAPGPLDAATAAVVLSLMDHETAYWLDRRLAGADRWIAFHTGAPVAPSSERAAFVITAALPPLESLTLGGHETPESSATVVVQVESLRQGTPYRLMGPGLREPATLVVRGLGDDFPAWWAANHRLFPRGVDLILCAGDQLAALPRTVSIQEG